MRLLHAAAKAFVDAVALRRKPSPREWVWAVNILGKPQSFDWIWRGNLAIPLAQNYALRICAVKRRIFHSQRPRCIARSLFSAQIYRTIAEL